MAKKKHRYTEHHRKPKAQGGSNCVSNLAMVRENHHQAWHTIFNVKMSPQKIAGYQNNKLIDPAYYFLCIPRKDLPKFMALYNKLYPQSNPDQLDLFTSPQGKPNTSKN